MKTTTFGQALRTLRNGAMHVTDLADRIGAEPHEVLAWEEDRTLPTREQFKKLTWTFPQLGSWRARIRLDELADQPKEEEQMSNDFTNTEFGTAVRLVRIEQNMTQETFGRAFGVNAKTIGYIENNHRSPKQKLHRAFCKAFPELKRAKYQPPKSGPKPGVKTGPRPDAKKSEPAPHVEPQHAARAPYQMPAPRPANERAALLRNTLLIVRRAERSPDTLALLQRALELDLTVADLLAMINSESP
jgi:DNA-binding XRE family transcriptional regulator